MKGETRLNGLHACLTSEELRKALSKSGIRPRLTKETRVKQCTECILQGRLDLCTVLQEAGERSLLRASSLLSLDYGEESPDRLRTMILGFLEEEFATMLSAAKKSTSLLAYCSWCGEKAPQKLVRRHYLQRNDFQCTACGSFTVECRWCKNMAKASPMEPTEDAGFIKRLKEGWSNELCSEHDGSVADFTMLDARLSDLTDYVKIFKRKRSNLLKAGKIAAGSVAGAVVVGSMVVGGAGAPIAAALGKTGLLGAAGTGTAISTLSGAALTSASLAAIGGGALGVGAGMTGGLVILSAAGAALGGRTGGLVSNSYFGAVDDFKIRKVNKGGDGPGVVFLNGFLSQKDQDWTDWADGAREQFGASPWYFTNWEAKSLYALGAMAMERPAAAAFGVFIKKLALKGTQKAASKLNPLSWAGLVADILGNPWHVAQFKAGVTGVLLADLLARTDRRQGFTIMGHSLGARVAHYLLMALSTKEEEIVEDVFLFGGAVGRTSAESWDKVSGAVRGNIFNFYSKNDDVLRYLYQGANALISKPIGLGPIENAGDKIINIDVSDIIKGHLGHKPNLAEMIRRGMDMRR